MPQNQATSRPSKSGVPWLIIIAGCLIALLTFGPRSAMGFFQLPLLAEKGWDQHHVRHGHGTAEPVLGCGPALLRRDRRQIRHVARTASFSDFYCERPCHDGLGHFAGHSLSRRRRARRAWRCSGFLWHHSYPPLRVMFRLPTGPSSSVSAPRQARQACSSLRRSVRALSIDLAGRTRWSISALPC